VSRWTKSPSRQVKDGYRSNFPWRGSWIRPARREREAACVRGSDGWNAAVHICLRASYARCLASASARNFAVTSTRPGGAPSDRSVMARSTGAMACHRVPAPPRAAAGRERCVARCRRRFASAAPASPGLARAGCDVSATLSSDGTGSSGDGGSPGSVASGAPAKRLPKMVPVMDRAVDPAVA
jgi:hypothetical protein